MKHIFAVLTSVMVVAGAPLLAQDPVFGSNESQWSNDGECDDRRFAGPGMAVDLDIANIGKDATDCTDLFASGSLTLWDATAATQATQCAALNFGDDSGEYPNDGECDDPRFEGIGEASQINTDNLFKDATDCSALCGYGAIALRDY
jgi:hypothetical protein